MQTPHDDNAALIAFYGDPAATGWEAANIVNVSPPWRMTYGAAVVFRIRFHKLAAPALQAALNDIWQQCGQDQNKLNATGLQNYSGSLAERPVRGSATKMSVHSFGAAIDFDAEHEGMNTAHISHMAPFVIQAFKNQGAFWGGDFKSRQDPMHFQWAHE